MDRQVRHVLRGVVPQAKCVSGALKPDFLVFYKGQFDSVSFAEGWREGSQES